MRNRLIILHPRPFDTLIPTPVKDTTGKPAYTFAVSGKIRNVVGLVACVIKQDPHTTYLYPGTVIFQTNGYFVASFTVPAAAVTMHADGWHCFIGQTDGTKASGGNLAASIEFSLLQPPQVPGDQPPDVGVITIQFPATGTTVSGAFCAWGPNSDHGGASFGNMSMNANNSYSGVPAPGAPNGSWILQFESVPDGLYTLSVGNAGGDQGSNPNITVDSEACPPVEAPPPPAGPDD